MAVQHPIDTEGRPIGPLRLRRGMILNVIGGCMIMVTMAVMSPGSMIGTVFLREQLGASHSLVGLNSTLWMAAMVFGLPGAWLFNRLRARRPTWVVLLATGRAFLWLVALAALLSGREQWRPALVWVVLCANFASAAFGAFIGSGFWGWMADLIPESIRGYFFGRRHRAMMLTTAVGLVLAGLILHHDTSDPGVLYFAIFLVAATLGVIDPILFWWVAEPARGPRPRNGLVHSMGLFLAPLKDRSFAALIWPAALQTLVATMPAPFFWLYQRGETLDGYAVGCGASILFMTILQVGWLVMTAMVAAQWGYLADRIGHRTVYVLGSLAIFTTSAYFVLGPQNYWWLLPIQVLLHGLIAAGAPVAMQNLMIGISPKEQREYYVSTFWVVVAGAGAIGPAVGGLLANAMPTVSAITLPHGQPVSYLHVLLVICYVGTLMSIFLMMRIPDVRGESLLPWLARMVSGGLLRTAWNISAVAGAASPGRRTRALRGIRSSDGNVVLQDVAEALEDPDPQVRREALLALGRIGTDEAIELLMWYMHEPDRQTRTVSAEALGASRSNEGTVPLVAALNDDDSHVRRAAADALGRRGDARASEILLRLLGREKDAEVLVSVASALSRVREFRAVRQMLAMALENPNRMVRTQMVVALGDLLGPPGQFYKLWRKERRLPGAATTKLARRIRRQGRAMYRLRCVPGRPIDPRAGESLTGIGKALLSFVDSSQQEDWTGSLEAVHAASLDLLRLRYDYHGEAEHALEFVAAVDPIMAERHWLVDYLGQTSKAGKAPEAAWGGLVLLAVWAILHGQPPT